MAGRPKFNLAAEPIWSRQTRLHDSFNLRYHDFQSEIHINLPRGFPRAGKRRRSAYTIRHRRY